MAAQGLRAIRTKKCSQSRAIQAESEIELRLFFIKQHVTCYKLVEAATITSPFKSTGYIAKRLKYPRKYPHEKLLGTDMVRGPKRRSRRVIGLRVLRICGQSTAEIDRPRRPSLSGGNCSRQPDHRRRPPLPAPSTGEHAALSHRRTAASGSAE